MSNLMGCCITLMTCTAKVRTFLKSAILRWKFSPPSQWCGQPEFRIKGKSRLVKSVAGPTGAVLFKSLPDGAVLGAKCMIFRTDRQCFDWKAACRCRLSAETVIYEIHNKGLTEKLSGNSLYYLEGMVTRTLFETIFRMNGQQSNMPQHFQSKNTTIFWLKLTETVENMQFCMIHRVWIKK